MQTQCPHCQTIFRITTAHLNIAQGHVQCGQCQNIFDATKHLKDEPKKVVNFSPETDYPELLQEEDYEEEPKWASLFWWTFIALGLVVLLAGQSVWFLQRDFILQHPQLRPWLERFCYTFLCNLPPTRDVKSFQIQEAFIQIHPSIKQAMKVDATFINNAPFPQPYPAVQLTFQDLNGSILAQRRFQPTEYLSPAYANKILKAGAIVHLQLELKDTFGIIKEGKVEEGYSFEFF